MPLGGSGHVNGDGTPDPLTCRLRWCRFAKRTRASHHSHCGGASRLLKNLDIFPTIAVSRSSGNDDARQ